MVLEDVQVYWRSWCHLSSGLVRGTEVVVGTGPLEAADAFGDFGAIRATADLGVPAKCWRYPRCGDQSAFSCILSYRHL